MVVEQRASGVGDTGWLCPRSIPQPWRKQPCILCRVWEISHVTTVTKADKSRLTIRGLVDGHQYIVCEQPGGWFITPEKNHRVKKTGMSAETFAKLYRSRTPLDADTAKEIAANLAATDQAK